MPRWTEPYEIAKYFHVSILRVDLGLESRGNRGKHVRVIGVLSAR